MLYDSMKIKWVWQDKNSYSIYEIAKQFIYLDQTLKLWRWNLKHDFEVKVNQEYQWITVVREAQN